VSKHNIPHAWQPKHFNTENTLGTREFLNSYCSLGYNYLWFMLDFLCSQEFIFYVFLFFHDIGLYDFFLYCPMMKNNQWSCWVHCYRVGSYHWVWSYFPSPIWCSIFPLLIWLFGILPLFLLVVWFFPLADLAALDSSSLPFGCSVLHFEWFVQIQYKLFNCE